MMATPTGSDSSSSSESLGCQPNQPTSFSFPKRKFGVKSPVFRSFQPSWYKRWPWIHYNQGTDKAFCFICLKASRLGMLKACASKGDDAFISRGYINWKDAVGKNGGFSSHEHSNVHKYSTDIVSKSLGDVGELLSSELQKEKAKNRAYLTKVLENIIFLARQGLAFRGSWVSSESENEGAGTELNSNFHQLLLLRSKDDPTILEFMQRKKHKYTDHHIQNELLKILALGHLRLIAANITKSGYFTLESDEVTDTSNKEQVIVCLRWVNEKLVAHEEFIGLHHVDDIKTDTIVRVLNDTILRMNLNLSMCRGQCYDGAANMKKASQEIKAIEPKALYMHCYGHSLNLAVSDTIKEVKPMCDTLDHCLEICKLIKFSPRRDAIFNKIKAELSPQVPGLRNLCPTRWTVRGNSLESIRNNYPTLLATWEEAVDAVNQSDVKARINGVASKMKEFKFLFCLMLAERLLKHSDNLSRTMQATAMPVVEAKHLAELCVEVLQQMREENQFDLFWESCLRTKEELSVNDPVLQRQRKRTRRYEDGTGEPHFDEDPKLYYRRLYYQCLDAATSTINSRFQQQDYTIYANLEQLLVKACVGKDFSEELKVVTDFYQADFSKSELETQLGILSCMKIEPNGNSLSFSDIHKHFLTLPASQLLLLHQVSLVIKFVLLMPATNAVSERSASAMRRIKTYLRSTMSQQRMNNVMVLHIHKHLTDSVNLKETLNEFVTANDERRKYFGLYE